MTTKYETLPPGGVFEEEPGSVTTFFGCCREKHHARAGSVLRQAKDRSFGQLPCGKHTTRHVDDRAGGVVARVRTPVLLVDTLGDLRARIVPRGNRIRRLVRMEV